MDEHRDKYLRDDDADYYCVLRSQRRHAEVIGNSFRRSRLEATLIQHPSPCSKRRCIGVEDPATA